MNNGWINLNDIDAPQGVEVETTIIGNDGCRNQQSLIREGNPDNSMYVYYTPTHWRHMQ